MAARTPAAAMARRRATGWQRRGRVALIAVALLSALVPHDAQANEDEFVVDQGDKLAIGVYRRPDLSGEFRVQPDGKLSLPFLGPVPAAGQTLDAVRAAIAQRLREDASLHETRISVELIEGRPIAVSGGVRRAGIYPFQIGMTVSHAVAAAGGKRVAELEELSGHVEAGRLRERLRQNRDALAAAQVRQARLLAERQDADSFDPPEEVRAFLLQARWDEVVNSERNLLKQRNDVVRSLTAALTNQIDAYKDEAQALTGQSAAKAREAELLIQEARYIEGLQRQGLSARTTRTIELARLSVQIEGERMQIQSYLAKARQEILRAEHTRTAASNQRQVEITQALREGTDLQHSLAVGIQETQAVLARLREALPESGAPAGEPTYVIVRAQGALARRIDAQGQTSLRPGDLVEVTLPAIQSPFAARGGSR